MSGPGGLRGESLALFLVVGLGTYLMRTLPLLATLGRLRSGPHGKGPQRRSGHAAPCGQSGRATEGRLLFALRLVAPAVVAALLVNSLLPARPGPGLWRELVVALAALVPTAVSAARWQNLGLTVLVGVVAYWALSRLGG